MNTLSTLDSVSINDITYDTNVRTSMDKDGLKELAASIEAIGVLEPVRLQRIPGGGYKLTAGYRRLAAIELLNKGRTGSDRVITHVPASIVESEQSDGERLVEQLVENLQREDLSVMDEARGYRALSDAGMQGKDIAVKVSRSPGHVSKRMKLTTLPAEAQKRVDSGNMRLETALDLADVAEKHPEAAAQAMKEHPHNPVWKAKTLVDELAAAAKMEAAVAKAEAAGMKVVRIQEPPLGEKPAKKVEGWVVVSKDGGGQFRMKGLQLDPNTHGKEPCHALAVVKPRHQYDPTALVACCTDPSRHTLRGESALKPAHAAKPPTDEKAKAARQETIARAKAQRVDGDRRLEFLMVRLARSLPKSVNDLALRLLIHVYVSSGESYRRKTVDRAMALCGIVISDRDVYGARGKAIEAFTVQSGADLARFALALVIAEHEGEGGKGLRDLPLGNNAVGDLLVELGYELSVQEKIDLGLAKPVKKATTRRRAAAKPAAPTHDAETEAILDDDIVDGGLVDDEAGAATA